MSFEALGLSPSLLKALAEQQYEKPFPIQEQAIPAILQGKDVLGIAQTGSGKTAGFVLPILTLLEGRKPSRNRHVRVLVVVPTRELAAQVGDVFAEFSRAMPERIRCLTAHGGVSINPQMKAMSGVQVLVATPGRLIDLVTSNAVMLSQVEILVLDEADKMLTLGFKEEMRGIVEMLPGRQQNLLFSATLSDQVRSIHENVLDEPVVVKIEPKEANLDLIRQSAYFLADAQKGPMLRFLIKTKEMEQVLVFTSSSYKADRVAEKLRKNGVEAMAIHGKKSQGARTESLRRFKTGKLRVLVATDLLSRGIDIEFLPWVINYELPRSPKDYVHRIGRTGRAEAEGDAISLIDPDSEHHWRIVQKKMKRRVEAVEWEESDLQGY